MKQRNLKSDITQNILEIKLINRIKHMQTSYSFLTDLNLSQQVINQLSILLSRTDKGDDQVIKTPLGENNDTAELLAEWDKVFQANLSNINEPLLAIEESNRSKYGPRSIQIPWVERRDAVLAYFEQDAKITNSESLITDPSELLENSRINGSLRPISLANAAKFLKNTNSGLPFYAKKPKVKDEVIDNFEPILQRRDPCVLFTRTQESKKTRAVWGYPIADTLLETRYYRPLLELQKKLPWRAAIVGPDQVDKSCTDLVKRSINDGSTLVSIDFSGYDASVTEQLQNASFDYIKNLFQAKEHANLDYIAERFNMIGLITPEGVWNGPHGVPSGSTFTNEVDSIAQFLVAKHSAHAGRDFQIQGDDGAYGTESPDRLIEMFADYGLSVNEEKSDLAANYVVYLQNLHHPDYVDSKGNFGGVYSTYRALNRLVFQERFNDFSAYGLEGKDFYSIRTISILENCRNHPLFKDFVKFIHSKDKYGLETTQQGIDKYIKMFKDKAGAEGIIQHQYGDQVTGIRSFETFKILSEL